MFLHTVGTVKNDNRSMLQYIECSMLDYYAGHGNHRLYPTNIQKGADVDHTVPRVFSEWHSTERPLFVSLNFL